MREEAVVNYYAARGKKVISSARTKPVQIGSETVCIVFGPHV